MTRILQPESEAQLNDVRSLMRGFVDWHRERHIADIDLINRYFDAEEYEREVAGLPGKYAPPTGFLLVAYHDGRPAGCVAMHDLGDRICEMKRMFVPPACRGLGIGRGLAVRIIAAAKAAGYRTMRLDTSKRQSEAIRLYERAGFTRVPPYYALSDDLKDWLVFLELTL